jgi:hypothetical protein
MLSLVFAVALIWPIPAAELAGRLSERGTLFVTLTLLVFAGAISGYVLRSRLTSVLVPSTLYAGGVVRWLMDDWGWRWPEWTAFLPASAGVLAVLLVTAGLSATIASHVIGAESQPFGRGTAGIRKSAALSALLALVAAAASFALPLGVFGALFGIGAVLAGISALQEGEPNRAEQVLAIAGISLGALITLWELVELGFMILRQF